MVGRFRQTVPTRTTTIRGDAISHLPPDNDSLSIPKSGYSRMRGAVGLSTAHITPHYSANGRRGQLIPRGNAKFLDLRMAHVQYARGGNYVKVRPWRPDPPEQIGGGRRGQITNFSPASRRRMFEVVNSIDRTRVWRPYFLTLTFHEKWPEDSAGRMALLDAFFKRLFREYGEFPLIWRVEWKIRDSGEHEGQFAPHFHILLFVDPRRVVGIDRPDLPDAIYRIVGLHKLREWVAPAWNAIADPGNEEHLKAGYSLTEARSWRGVNSYLSKYVAKVEQYVPASGTTGQHWGYRNKDLLPISYEIAYVHQPTVYKLRRVMRRYAKTRAHRSGGQKRELKSFFCFLAERTTNRLLAFYGYYRS